MHKCRNAGAGGDQRQDAVIEWKIIASLRTYNYSMSRDRRINDFSIRQVSGASFEGEVIFGELMLNVSRVKFIEFFNTNFFRGISSAF